MKVLGAAGGGVNPLVVIGAIVLLIGLGIGGYAFWQQRKRAEMVRQYQEAQALARARRTQQRGPRAPGGNSGNNGYSNPGSGSGYGRQPAMRGGPPPRNDRAPSSGQSGQLGQRRPPTSNGSPGGRAPRQGSQSGRGDW